MLDLPTMVHASMAERYSLVAKQMLSDLTQVLARYAIPDFDSGRFLRDLKEWLDRNVVTRQS
jgi:hypothetical protein